MKTVGSWLVVLLAVVSLFAQQGPPGRIAGAHAPRTDELQTFLGLSDQQLQDLSAIRKAWRDAAQPLMQQIGEKMKALRDAVAQDRNSALVTQLKAELEDLRVQEQSIRSQYRDQAQNVLTQQQKTKLTTLQQALELMPVIRQATGLNLLDGPPDFWGGPGGMGMRGRPGDFPPGPPPRP